MKKLMMVLAVASATMMVVSCGPKRKVGRTSADAVTDLSGKWNDTDAKLVSQEMIKDCMARPWLGKFKSENGRSPVVRVKLVKNRSREHIDVNMFTKQIERELLNTGEIEFKAKKDEINQVREEQDESMGGRISDDSDVSVGNEAGVDFVLIGEINMNVDQAEGQKAKFYQVTMELHNVNSGKKAWIGEKQIKKMIEQAGVGW